MPLDREPGQACSAADGQGLAASSSHGMRAQGEEAVALDSLPYAKMRVTVAYSWTAM